MSRNMSRIGAVVAAAVWSGGVGRLRHYNYDTTVRNKNRRSGCSCSVVGRGQER
jgi:hypothetical protein